MTQSVHKAVLLHEIVRAFVSADTESTKKPSSTSSLPLFLDGTLGGCGHSLAIAEAFHGKIGIVGLDQDPSVIERAKTLLEGRARSVILENENFRNIDRVMSKYKLDKINLALMDLGISSDELETSGKGFSFQKDEPLLMTLGNPENYAFTAKDIVNGWKEEDISNVIFAYGEERYARRIAKRIVEYRQKTPIQTSAELAEIVKGAIPRQWGRVRIHPATKTFQALRIAVNDELKALEEGLTKIYAKLENGGKMAVISFHSLEDRIVKDFYKQKSKAEGAEVSKKPIRASAEEVTANPRSRSAKLRILAKKA